MSKFKVQYPVAYGGRREKGEILELTEEQASRLGDAVSPVESEVTAPEEVEEKDLDEMSADELKEKAIELELPTSGTKADLIERITLAGASDDEEEVEEDKE